MKKILVMTVQTIAVWAVVVLLVHAWNKGHENNWLQFTSKNSPLFFGSSGIVAMIEE